MTAATPEPPQNENGETASDRELLRRYLDERAEPAFAALVQRHLSLVYFAALRRTENPALAEEVAQEVFSAVAQKASTLQRHATLAGWLYTATRYAAAQKMRAEETRQRREQDSFLMNTLLGQELAPDWERLRPVIDDALERLGERDREALLMRFFEGRALREIGTAQRVSEDAVRMRIERALEKLRGALVSRGVTSTAAAIATVLAAQGTMAAPGGLALSIAGNAIANASVVSSSAAAVKIFGFMSTTKLAIGVAGVVIVAATALTFQQRQTNFQLRAEVAALHQQVGAMATLREENRRLQESNAASADQVSAEHGEVVKLRGELDTIKKAIAAARARMANGTNANATAGTGKSADADGMFSVDLMKNVGNATPNAAAESIVWAMQRADVKRVAALLRVESPDREKLEAFIQTMPPNLQDEYGSPAKLIALMMCGTPRPLAAVQQLGEEQVSDNEIVHHVQMKFQDGEVRRDDIRFRRDIDGWKQVVSPTTVDRVIAYFKDKK